MHIAQYLHTCMSRQGLEFRLYSAPPTMKPRSMRRKDGGQRRRRAAREEDDLERASPRRRRRRRRRRTSTRRRRRTRRTTVNLVNLVNTTAGTEHERSRVPTDGLTAACTVGPA
ncbi:hypothetical protein P167DRAFT_231594 [Morchella conica CCBAS932]|uniref:Uncharacterized protein n=1 Tax=Morchella conica CCBAS932 TaxID=1392247 RepID=A0A3N4KZ21_9PEZI|nr:hypothetical protein P167DRAFT_231594 [Morchella conica CCBAS932]